MTNDIMNVNLIKDIKSIIEESKRLVVKNVNTIIYWMIGRRIVEEEQKGNKKAEYGSALLKELSKGLTKEYGKGFSKSNLFSMRRFYIEFQKFQTLSGKLSWSHNLLLLAISDINA